MEGYMLHKIDNKWKKPLYYRLEEDKLWYFETHESLKPIGIYGVKLCV